MKSILFVSILSLGIFLSVESKATMASESESQKDASISEELQWTSGGDWTQGCPGPGCPPQCPRGSGSDCK